jgi:hypothetical protein
VLNAATPTQVITITNIGTQNQVLKYLDMGVVGTDATSFFIVSTTKPASDGPGATAAQSRCESGLLPRLHPWHPVP